MPKFSAYMRGAQGLQGDRGPEGQAALWDGITTSSNLLPTITNENRNKNMAYYVGPLTDGLHLYTHVAGTNNWVDQGSLQPGISTKVNTTIQTLTPGSNATVSASVAQDSPNSSKVFNFSFGIPRGTDAGFATTQIGKISSLPSGSTPTISITSNNSNTSKQFTFNFGVPVGLPAGFGIPTATITTLAAGANPTVNISSSGSETSKIFNFNFGFPKNITGTLGELNEINLAEDEFIKGVLPIERGGTGVTTAVNAANIFINALSPASATPPVNARENIHIITETWSGTTGLNKYYRRPISVIYTGLIASDITAALGYTPLQSVTKNAVTTALQYTPLENTAKAITTTLGYTPLQNITKNTVTTALQYTPLENTAKAITTTLGYTPLQSVTKNAVTTALQYTPLENTAKAITTTLGYTPVNKVGDTMSGNLTISKASPYLYLKNTYMDIAATTQASSRSSIIYFADKNDKNLAYIQTNQTTTALTQLNLCIRNIINSVTSENKLTLSVDKDGIKTVKVSDPLAWRNALGIGEDIVTVTTYVKDNYLPLSGGTVIGTLTLSRTQDASGTADNKPALIIGSITGTHLEIDGNEVMAKSNATTTGTLYINNDGGLVHIGSGGLTIGKPLELASGGLGVNASSVTKNYVFATPSTANGAPSFRALVAADIPLISLTTKVSGILPIANGGTGKTNASEAWTALGGGDLGKLNSITKAMITTALGYTPVNIDGDTITGNIYFKNSDFSITTGGYTKDYERVINFRDKYNTSYGVIDAISYSTNKNTLFLAVRTRNNSGSNVNNGISLILTRDGTSTIASVSFSYPEAWRKALGLGTDGAFPITPAQGGTGQITARDAANAFINALATGTAGAKPARDSYIINQHTTISNTTYFRRTVSDFFKSLTTSDITTALGYTPLKSTVNAITTTLGYTPLNKAGDTITGPIISKLAGTWTQIYKGQVSGLYIQRANLNLSSPTYNPAITMQTNDSGSWTIGTYTNNNLRFDYAASTLVAAGTKNITKTVSISPEGVFSGTASKATSADQLTTARTILIDLASENSASFNGTANITPGIKGTLATNHGGTGKATATKNQIFAGPSEGNAAAPSFRALVAADIPLISLTTKVSGILPIANGGTGTTTGTKNYVFATPSTANGAPSFRALVAADIPSLTTGKITSGVFPVTHGGTGATTGTKNYVFATPSTANGAPSFRALVAADIPSLTTGKITDGTFEIDRIPKIPLDSKISGKLSIVNGGTNATNATTAVKNLFGTNVGETATHFLVITTSWEKVGYASAANAWKAIGGGSIGKLNALTKDLITTGLGYTPVNKVGDTVTGQLILSKNSTSTLVIGTATGVHTEFGSNKIYAKTNTTITDLYLQDKFCINNTSLSTSLTTNITGEIRLKDTSTGTGSGFIKARDHATITLSNIGAGFKPFVNMYGSSAHWSIGRQSSNIVFAYSDNTNYTNNTESVYRIVLPGTTTANVSKFLYSGYSGTAEIAVNSTLPTNTIYIQYEA